MTDLTQETSHLKLPSISPIEKEILDLVKDIDPQSLYNDGFEELGNKVFSRSNENIEYARRRVSELKSKLGKNDDLERKYLDSIENVLQFEEPSHDIGIVSETFANHLVKEGLNEESFKILAGRICESIHASLKKFEGKEFPASVKVLTQYQVLGAKLVLDSIIHETRDPELIDEISELKQAVEDYRLRFLVEGFTDGQFEEVKRLLEKYGADLGRQTFYPKVLRFAFDYWETPAELERKALSWLKEDLPKMQSAVKKLSRILGCETSPEIVERKLESVPGVRAEDAIAATRKIRPIVQEFVSESIVGINKGYSTTVIETPPYLSAVYPTAAAQGFDSLTDHPIQRFYITTDPKRAPPGGFAELVNTLVHEEYGHCVHFSNTSARFAASPKLVELLPSLHGGTTSEGLAFQRELEFLDALDALRRKKSSRYTDAEKNYIQLTDKFGGFERTCLELEFSTFKQRIIRFLRVLGDSRINSGKQNLLEFLKWAEEYTGLSQRTVYFQIFPAHEGAYPGYATCYAVVGQEIRDIQRSFKNDAKKMVSFNAYASSMGFPARSIYIKRLREFARKLKGRKRRTALKGGKEKKRGLRKRRYKR